LSALRRAADRNAAGRTAWLACYCHSRHNSRRLRLAADHTYYTETPGELQIRSLDSDAVSAVEVPGETPVGLVPGAGHPGGKVVDFFVQSNGTGQIGVIRVVDGRLQRWPLAFRSDMYPKSLIRLPDAHLLVALQHSVGIAS
jgi:hypothetical protein